MKTINIKGKEYIPVNERLIELKKLHPDYSLISEIVSPVEKSDQYVIIKASVLDENGRVLATGHAMELQKTKGVNETSHVENCETSAWGRALGCLGIGIEHGVASADEMGKTERYKQPQKPKFTKSATFYLDLFGRMDWTKKESPPKNRQYFKDFCKKFSINSYIVGWGDSQIEPEKMRMAIKTVSGLDIDYQTTLNENQINKIKFAIVQMLEGGEE